MMNWNALGGIGNQSEWETDTTYALGKNIEKDIVSLNAGRQEFDADEAAYQATSPEDMTAKTLAIGRKLTEKRLELLTAELSVRKALIEYYGLLKLDNAAWHSTLPSLAAVEQENRQFLVANGWTDNYESGSPGALRQGFIGACRSRDNWRQAKHQQSIRMDYGPNISYEEEKIKAVTATLVHMRNSAVK